jgi:hypothetical protein
MGSRKQSRSNSRTAIQGTKRPPIPTLGEIFSDGSLIDAIGNAATKQPQLLLSSGGKRVTGTVLKFRRKEYGVAAVDPSIFAAVRLPAKCRNFGSTEKLFADVRSLFLDRGFSSEAIFPIPFLAFSTWFPEALPTAPTLSVTGPEPEAQFLLLLLGCIVRHRLSLMEVTATGLYSLPPNFRPTLLIHQHRMGFSKPPIFMSSNRQNVQFLRNGRLVDLFCPKIVYSGEAANGENFGQATLRVDLNPISGYFPSLDSKEQATISKEFQGKMQEYRCRNFGAVNKSACDFPEFEWVLDFLGEYWVHR